MATKRAAPHVHSSRQNQVPDEPQRKRRKPDNAGPKSFKKAHPVNELKSQIRSLKRLLERDDKLPATVRIEKERALQTAQHELEETQRAKQKSDMIGRYHKARFFDKQKAAKRLKQARKALKACEDGGEGDRVELEEKVREGEVDVNYAQYFPLEQHYVSLFPRKKTDGEDEEGAEDEQQKAEEPIQKGDAEMRQRVKQCMEDGTLEDLRHGRLDRETRELNPVPRTKVTGDFENKQMDNEPQNGRPGEAVDDVRDEADAESDGGFFE